MKGSAQTLDQALNQLSEFFAPEIVASYMDNISFWHRANMTSVQIAERITFDLRAICPDFEAL